MHHSPDLKTCLDIIRSLDDYLSRELGPEEEAHLQRHLRLCEECARHFRFEERLVALVRAQAQRASAPPHLRQRLLQALEGV